jgi:hypothetical protein
MVGQMFDNLALFLLRDFVQREVSQERIYRATAELNVRI